MNLCYSSEFQGSLSFIERLSKEFRKNHINKQKKKRKVYISVTLLCKECGSSVTSSSQSVTIFFTLCVCVLLSERLIRRILRMVERQRSGGYRRAQAHKAEQRAPLKRFRKRRRLHATRWLSSP